MKRFLALILGIVMLAGLPGTAGAAESSPTPTIILDGLPLAFPVPPTIIEGRTMVPFRAIAEALGVAVLWSDENQSIQAYGPDSMAYLKIGVKTIWVNGIAKDLDVPPMLVGDRTLVPLRAFSDAFGATVGWDGETFTVSITSPLRRMRMLAFYAQGSFLNRHLLPDFSDAAFGWSLLNGDGTLNLKQSDSGFWWPDPNGEITPELLLQDARAAGTRRLLVVHQTDRTLQITNLIRDEALIARTAASIDALVTEKNLDGVILDLEGLGLSEQGEELAQVRQGYLRLVTAVAERMRAAGKETAVSLPPPNGAYSGYDYAGLAPVVDTIQLMAHDYLIDQPEPDAMVEEAIRMTVEAVGEANRSKVLLGLRFFETPETLTRKVGLAKRYNLGGITFWTLGRLTPEQKAALDATVTPRK